MGSESGPLDVRWLGRVPYMKALLLQRRLRRELLAGRDPDRDRDRLLLMEHPPVVTLGRRAGPGDLSLPTETLRRQGVGVFRVERGGRATWHGPGQLVGYPVVSLARHGIGSARFVAWLAAWLEERLRDLGVEARYSAEAPGLWAPGGKIAALGLHTHRGVTLHGFSLNLAPRVPWQDWLDPCGLGSRGVTSVAEETGSAPAVASFARQLVAKGVSL